MHRKVGESPSVHYWDLMIVNENRPPCWHRMSGSAPGCGTPHTKTKHICSVPYPAAQLQGYYAIFMSRGGTL